MAVPSRVLCCNSLTTARVSHPPNSGRSSAMMMATSCSSPISIRRSARASSLSPSAADFAGHTFRPEPTFSKRAVVTRVIPYRRGSAREQPPPDLASYLFKNRIVYLGMPLYAAVTELMLAEFMYLQDEDPDKPIYFYINSTGTTRGDRKFGYEAEAFAIYDVIRFLTTPLFTLCVGNAWSEAALLLAAGSKGNRAALPSSTIMIKEPIGRYQGQASEIKREQAELQEIKKELVILYARHIGKTTEEIERDIRRPKYFSPSDAVEYGIIDKVLYNEKSSKDSGGVVSELKKANII